jgi:hypothetical protein
MNKLTPDEKWNQWFAGLIDGDGSFVLNQKEKTVSFEITNHVTGDRQLYNIKDKLKAGTVKARSGSKSVRYRIKQKAIICEIVKRVSGKVYHPKRIIQLKNACALFNLTYIQPPALILQPSAYLSGLIDSDGSFAISVTNSTAEDSQLSGVNGRIVRLINAKGFSQISAKITSTHKDFLEIVQQSYNFGTIYVEQANPKNKSPKNKYHLTIKSEDEFIALYNYLKKYPLKSTKMHRMRLALLYFKYKKLRYHLASPGTVQHTIWKKFANSWYKYSF